MAAGQQPVDGGAQLRLIAGAGSLRLMLDVAFSFVLAGNDDGQAVLLTDPVAGSADEVIAALVGLVVLMILKADGVEEQVVLDVIPVCVGGQDKLLPAAQDLPCPLHADLMGLLRRDLPRLKGLDQVAAQVRSLVDGMAAGPGKFDIRSLGGAAIGGYKQLSVCLFWVADIVNGRFQR